MLEGVVAQLINSYLGKYIQDLDGEKLNVGIFSGTVDLNDLRLRSDALSGLDLPIEVLAGSIGRLSIDIPWLSLGVEPAMIRISDVMILAAPYHYKSKESDCMMQRSRKNQKLAKFGGSITLNNEASEKPKHFLENLISTVVNTIQISVTNVHVRYEDAELNSSLGFVIHSFTAQTTNSRWKAAQIDSSSPTIYKLLRLQAFSVYCNTNSSSDAMISNTLPTSTWLDLMLTSTQRFQVNDSDFQFLLKPTLVKAKMIVNKQHDRNVPKMLVDVFVQDLTTHCTKSQYNSICTMKDNLSRLEVQEQFNRYRTDNQETVNSSVRERWRFVIKAILEHYVRPKQWSSIKTHRQIYRSYRDCYLEHLRRPNDAEIRLDLRSLEDKLNLINIILARYHATSILLKESPSTVEVEKKTSLWWKHFLGLNEHEDGDYLNIVAEHHRSLWSHLTAEEKQIVFKAIGLDQSSEETETTSTSASSLYIAHQVNFTLAKSHISFANDAGNILVTTVDQLLISFKTRPAVQSFKASVRAERFVVEGAASTSGQVSPFIQFDSTSTDFHSTIAPATHVFVFDFEKNPVGFDADYSIILNVQPFEIILQKPSILALEAFFGFCFYDLRDALRQTAKQVSQISKNAVTSEKRIYVDLQFKSPRLIIPEFGDIEGREKVIVFSMGEMFIKSNLQDKAADMEAATKTEIEERLYDQLRWCVCDAQLILSESGADWRDERQPSADSEYHFLANVSLDVLLARNIKPQLYSNLPRNKIDVNVSTININLSDKRIDSLVNFISHFNLHALEITDVTVAKSNNQFSKAAALIEQELSDLCGVLSSHTESKRSKEDSSLKTHTTESDLTHSSGWENSDDEEWNYEQTAILFDKTVLTATTVIRTSIGEIDIKLDRSGDKVDKPYLMLRVERLSFDGALTEYGHVLKASLGAVFLVDKLNRASAGEYIELVSSGKDSDLINILYRKVSPRCLQFKSVFRQVKNLVNISTGSLSITVHNESICTLTRYLLLVYNKIGLKWNCYTLPWLQLNEGGDFPTSASATNLSLSCRIGEIKARFQDADVALADLSLSGVSLSYVKKMNDKRVIRGELVALNLEDLSSATLYPKVLYTDDDKVFDFKLLWDISKTDSDENISLNIEKPKSNSEPLMFRLRFGHLHVVYIKQFINQIKHFLESLVNSTKDTNTSNDEIIKKTLEKMWTCFAKSKNAYWQYSVSFGTPTLVLPRGEDSSDCLVCTLGDLKVENMVRNTTSAAPFVNNVLLTLDNIGAMRGISKLDGTLELQEAILEPCSVSVDIKCSSHLVPNGNDCQKYDISGRLDLIKVNVGYRDLKVLSAILRGNILRQDNQTLFETTTTKVDESAVEDTWRIHFDAFSACNLSGTVFIEVEGIEMTLYADEHSDQEGLSSPVRLAEQELVRIAIGESRIQTDFRSDSAHETNFSVSSIRIFDCRSGTPTSVLDSFYTPDVLYNESAGTSTASNILDCMAQKNTSDDLVAKITVEKIKCYITISLLMALMHFLQASTTSFKPNDRVKNSNKFRAKRNKSKKNEDKTGSTTVSIVFKRPEILLSQGPPDLSVILAKMDFAVNFIQNQNETVQTVSIENFEAFLGNYETDEKTMEKLCSTPLNMKLLQTTDSNDNQQRQVDIKSGDFIFGTQLLSTISEWITTFNAQLPQFAKRSLLTENYIALPLEDMWSPKPADLERFKNIDDEISDTTRPPFPDAKPPKQTITLNIPSISMVYKMQSNGMNIPALFLKAAVVADLNNFTRDVYLSASARIEALYYHEALDSWEPLIEPVMEEENVYRPFSVSVKIFREKSYPILSESAHENKAALCQIERPTPISDVVDGNTGSSPYRSAGSPRNAAPSVASMGASSLSLSASEDSDTCDESGNETTKILRRTRSKRRFARSSRMSTMSRLERESVTSRHLTTNPDDESSDSESEAGVVNRISKAFHQLLSDGDDESKNDESSLLSGDNNDVVDAESGISDVDDQVYYDPSPDRQRHQETASAFRGSVLPPIISDDPGPGYAFYIIAESQDPLNLNVTPSVVDVVKEIVNGLKGEQGVEFDPTANSKRSLVLNNFLGPDSRLSLLRKSTNGQFVIAHQVRGEGQSLYRVADANNTENGFLTICMKDGGCPVRLPVNSKTEFKEKTLCELQNEHSTEKLCIDIPSFDKLYCWVPKRSCCLTYALQPSRDNIRYSVVLDVKLVDGKQIITLRSPLTLENRSGRTLHVLCLRSQLNAAVTEEENYANKFAKNPFLINDAYARLTTLSSGANWNVPLVVAYHCKLFVQPLPTTESPAVFTVSTEGIWSHDVYSGHRHAQYICCAQSIDDGPDFYIRVVCAKDKNVELSGDNSDKIPAYVISFNPPVVIHNALPYSVQLHFTEFDKSYELSEGGKEVLYNASPRKNLTANVSLASAMGSLWSGKLDLGPGISADDVNSIVMTNSDKTAKLRTITLSVITRFEGGSLNVFLYSPFWIVNKSQLNLPVQIRSRKSETVYEVGDDIVLFRFRKRNEKKAKLRVGNTSAWSSSFNINTPGNTGVIICTDKERHKKYRNRLRFMEENKEADLWQDIEPFACVPFWPETGSMRMCVRLQDSSVISQNFNFDYKHSTVLRMGNFNALTVEISGGTDSAMKISFFDYQPGDAPVRIENLCEDIFIKIRQKNSCQVTLLRPYQQVLYTWDDPCIQRVVFWNVYTSRRNDFVAQIYKDGYGHQRISFQALRSTSSSSNRLSKETSKTADSSSDDEESETDMQEKGVSGSSGLRRDKIIVYWVSYMEKQQRVFLFTQDERIFQIARANIYGEHSRLECFISMEHIGVSLINLAMEELAYLTLATNPSSWEVEIRSTWKALTLEVCSWLEYHYLEFLQSDDEAKSNVEIKGVLQVDFKRMQMVKPFLGPLKRIHNPAVWCQVRKSPNQVYVHAKIQRMQIDNQLPDAIFPTVLHQSPLLDDDDMRQKPVIEAIAVINQANDLNLVTVKYLKLLVQELQVKVDKGFLMSIIDMAKMLNPDIDERELLQRDLRLLQKPLYSFKKAKTLAAIRAKRIRFDYIHLSPIKLRVSFSPRGTPHQANRAPATFARGALAFFLDSFGSLLTEMKDIEIRLAYFEQEGQRGNVEDLVNDVKAHYIVSLVQQCYVVLLGLDVLGNPYGLVKDFTRGLGDLFYEPIMGSFEGSEQFADGLAKGAQSFLGHVVGSTAGSMSLIAGSVGQMFASLTFDSEYQRRRQLRMEQRPEGFPQSLALAAKGLMLGVGVGISGCFIDPISGAQEDGVGGFFRGLGRGLIGLVTKPPGGVADMFAVAFDGIKRAVELGAGVVVRQRLPRFINPTVGIRPYSSYQAMGYRLLFLLSKSQYSHTDIYIAHAPLSERLPHKIAIVTNRHIMQVERSRLWSVWNVEWSVKLDDVLTVPQLISSNALQLKIRRSEPSSDLSGDEKCIVCNDTTILNWLQTKIEMALLTSLDEKPCSPEQLL